MPGSDVPDSPKWDHLLEHAEALSYNGIREGKYAPFSAVGIIALLPDGRYHVLTRYTNPEARVLMHVVFDKAGRQDEPDVFDPGTEPESEPDDAT